MCPALIVNAYCEEHHHHSVPGSSDVKLMRTGAYVIYHENSSSSGFIIKFLQLKNGGLQ